MKGKVSLYYNQITIGLQSGYNQLHHPLHLESTQYKQFLQKKRKQKEEAKDKGERQNEGERKERGEKEEKEKKGWKEFIRKERKRESERWKKR